MSSKGLSVTEYSKVLLSRYLQQAFDTGDRDKNLSIAAKELFVLLRKLRGTAGERSEDAKAPLKAVRDAIEVGAAAQAEQLFLLLTRLQELCEERAARGMEREQAVGIQETLRYRLARLVAGDAWDHKPALKLRALKLMFEAMVRENEALRHGTGAGQGDGGTAPLPELCLTRSHSFGKGCRGGGGGGAGQAPPHSKWQDAIQALGNLQGSKLLPLMKLLLAENFQMASAAEEAAAAAAAEQEFAPEQGSGAATAPTPSGAAAGPPDTTDGVAQAPVAVPATPAPVAVPATPAPARFKAVPQHAAPAPQAFSIDDLLLGLNDLQEGSAEEGQRPPSSPRSSVTSDDPFAALVEGRGPQAAPAGNAAQPGLSPSVEGAGPRLSSMSISVPARPSQQYAYALPASFAPLAASTQGGYGVGPMSPYLPQSPHNAGAAFMPYLPHSPPAFQPVAYQTAGFQSSTRTPEAVTPVSAGQSPGAQFLAPQYLGGSGDPGVAAMFISSGGMPAASGQGEGGHGATGRQMGGGPPSAGGSSSASSRAGLQGGASSADVVGNERLAPSALFEASFDTSSPYFGKSNPFGSSQFQDLSPLQAHRPPPAQRGSSPKK